MSGNSAYLICRYAESGGEPGATEKVLVCGEYADGIQLGMELGRLDFISALLAGIAILMVFAAVPFYFHIRSRATSLVKTELASWRAEAMELVEQLAVQELEERLPALAQDYVQLAANSVDPETANKIAEAQDDGTAS